jgi:hypothetical protein
MTMPNLDQTEVVWISVTSDQGYHYAQAVFPGNTAREQWYQANCRVFLCKEIEAKEEGPSQAPTS